MTESEGCAKRPTICWHGGHLVLTPCSADVSPVLFMPSPHKSRSARIRRFRRWRAPAVWNGRDGLPERRDAAIAAVADQLGPWMMRYFGAQVRGTDRVPEGGVLFVGNHSGGLGSPDSFVFGYGLYLKLGMSAVPWGLAHQTAMDAPVIGPLLRAIGGVKAGPGAGKRLLQAGRNVLVYPGGDVDSMRPSHMRHNMTFDGRQGYIRLAMAANRPIVPVVAAGGHSVFWLFGDLMPVLRAFGLDRRLRLKTFPMGLSVPWGITPGPPPPYVPLPSRILIEILEPIYLPAPENPDYPDPEIVDKFDALVQARMREALARLVAERKKLGRAAVRDWFRR
jgi:1-acyl-sn-glycerol-3-phosphate acyltransferase